MDSTTSILIADDHTLIRQGLRKVLEAETGFQVLEAENGDQALKKIRGEKPDIAILDVEMPRMTGFEVAQQIQKESLSIDIIFLTMFKDESMFNNAMDIGVKGYVLKENTVSEIVKCVESVIAGKHYLSPEMSDMLIRRNTSALSSTSATDKNGLHLLTPSEKNIMQLLATMKTNQEIAEELNISPKTVKNHRNNICNKLDLSGAHALLKFAMEHESKL